MCGKMDRYYLPTYTLPLWGISWIRSHWCHSGPTFAFAWITPLPSLSLLKRLLISVNVWTSSCKWMCKLPSGSQSMVPGAVWTSFSPVQSQTFDSGILLLSWPSALKNAISPSLSFSYCLFLTMTAVPFLKSVLVSFPCPPTHNLIYACVCLHIISFQWDCLSMSVWTAHIICVSEQKYLHPPLLSHCALSTASFVICEGHHHRSVCHRSTQHGFLCIALLCIHIQAMSKGFKILSAQISQMYILSPLLLNYVI